VRLDIQAQAQEFASIINGERNAGGRPINGEARIIVRVGDWFVMYGAGASRAKHTVRRNPGALVGIYTPGVTVEQIIEDLEASA
jgi:hypothetical protein